MRIGTIGQGSILDILTRTDTIMIGGIMVMGQKDPIMLTMTTGGESDTLMIITFRGKTFLIISIGVEVLGEMSTGGGIEREGSFTTQSISLRKGTLDGGMGYLTIEICLQTT
jgi:hypothetical protein